MDDGEGAQTDADAFAQQVRARIECTSLGDVTKSIENVMTAHEFRCELVLDMRRIRLLRVRSIYLSFYFSCLCSFQYILHAHSVQAIPLETNNVSENMYSYATHLPHEFASNCKFTCYVVNFVCIISFVLTSEYLFCELI